MRTLGNILQIVSRESPLTLLRETQWRITRRRRQNQLPRLLQATPRCSIRMVPYYDPKPAAISDEQRQIIIELADGICRGNIPFLSYGTQELGFSPAWSRDFMAGKEWPMQPSRPLPVIRFDGSDIKVPWELSRLQFLPILGKAWRLTRKIHYREVARNYVDDWIKNNPVGQGVNWIVAMEVALRALSIIFLLNLLWPLANEEKEWQGRVVESLWQHLIYIEANLEFSHLVRGNHYLSNLAGLYGLATFLDGPGMSSRRRRYQHLLEREILLHVYPDGGNYEASTGYHVLVTQIFFTAWRLMRANDATADPAFVDRLRKMFVWMNALSDANGRLPHIGDCDDGRVEFLFDDLKQMATLPLQGRDSLRVLSLLGLGDAFLGSGMKGSVADAPWYGAETTGGDHGARKSQASGLPELLPDSGIAMTASGGNDLLFLALPNGIHGRGTHTHNDKLSVILRMEGEEVLCDPGTGCYTRDGVMRNRFRSTAAHNTVMIDGEEQNRIPGGRNNFFSLGNEARVGRMESEDGVHRLSASHFGYSDKGIVHSRSVEWRGSNRIQIVDRFSGSGKHQVAAHFHAAPGWKFSGLSLQENVAKCVLEGKRTIRLNFKADNKVGITQIPFSNSWIYGAIVPSFSLRVETSADFPASLETDISWDE